MRSGIVYSFIGCCNLGPPQPNSTAIIDNQWKLIVWYEEGTVELYNLEEDHSEQNDLSKTMPEKTSDMLAKIHQWRKEVKAPILDPSNDKKRQKKQK